MADVADIDEAEAPKASKLPMILGLCLALVGGGGGFYATWSGMILSSEAGAEKPAEKETESQLPDVAFVEIPAITVGVHGGTKKSHLRFGAQIEVPAAHRAEVELIMPRLVDVLNGYLRAVRTSDLEDPNALPKLRAQMLRRLQIVTGRDKINDLLIMEFIVN